MAGAINLANVAIGFDASKVIKGVDLSAGEIRKLGSIVRASESALDKYNKELHILTVAHAKGAISAELMAKAEAHLRRELEKSGKTAGNLSSGGKDGGLALPFTEMASALSIARQGLHMMQAAIRPVFDEMNRIDAINDQAHKLGMSYRDLNTIQLSLGESSGLAADDIAKAMQKLSIGVTEAITSGKGAHAEALKTLGLNASALAGKNQVNQLATIADAMAGIASQSERLRLTFDLFGKTGAGLVSSFDEGGGKLREMAEFADAVGHNLSGTVVEGVNNANDAIDRLSMATQGWMAQFTGGIAPAIGAIAEDMTGMVDNAKQMAELGKETGIELAKQYAMWKDLARISQNPIGAWGKSIRGQEEMFSSYEKVLDRVAKAEIKAADDAAEKYKQQKQTSERKGKEEKEAESAKSLKALIDVLYTKTKLESEHINEVNKQTAEYVAKEKEIWDAAFERDLKQRNDTNPLNISDTIAPALKSGSVEAYKYMLSQQDKGDEIAEKHKQIAEESKDILNKQLDALNNMPKLGLARR